MYIMDIPQMKREKDFVKWKEEIKGYMAELEKLLLGDDQNLDVRLVERSSAISGGEKQKIAINRMAEVMGVTPDQIVDLLDMHANGTMNLIVALTVECDLRCISIKSTI